jgi:hypothetical protein
MSIVIDTPEGIAFARAAARLGALKLHQRGVYTIVKRVYGFTGGVKTVTAMLQEYVDGVLTVRAWEPAYSERIHGIAQEAIRRAEEEHGQDPRLKDIADANVQAFFESGSITEQEGNDACLLLYVEVVRQHAGRL